VSEAPGTVLRAAATASGGTRRRWRQGFLWGHFLLSISFGHLYLSSPMVLIGACAYIAWSNPHLAAVILSSVVAVTSLGHVFLYLAGLVDPAFFEAYESGEDTRRAVIHRSVLGLALSSCVMCASVFAIILLSA